MKSTALRRRLLGVLLLGTTALAAASPRENFLAAKQAATDANYRNDQAGLRGAIARFATLQSEQSLAHPALYHAAWTEWLLAASQIGDKQTASAVGHPRARPRLEP